MKPIIRFSALIFGLAFVLQLGAVDLKDAKKAALAETRKYIDLYGDASITFDPQTGYAMARPMACLALAYFFNHRETAAAKRAPDSGGQSAGVMTGLARGREILDTLAESYLQGKWGKASWTTAMPVLNMGFAARIGQAHLSTDLLAKVERVVRSEADFLLTIAPFSNDSARIDADCKKDKTDVRCDTKSEENAVMATMLGLGASLYKDKDKGGRWLKKARLMAYHSLTRSSDPPFGGIKTLTIFDDFTMGNHNIYPNPHYMCAAPVVFAEAALFFSLAGMPLPPEFRHNVAPLWERIKGFMNTRDFRWKDFESDYAHDSPLWFPSAFAYAAVVLDQDRELLDALLKKKANTDFVAIPNSKKKTEINTFEAEFFTNSNVTKRYIVACLLLASATSSRDVPEPGLNFPDKGTKVSYPGS